MPFIFLRPSAKSCVFCGWDGVMASAAFNCIFLNENIRISIKISLKFVLKSPINNYPSLIQIRVIPRYWVPLFVSVKCVCPTCLSNVTFTISYLLYLLRQFAEWEASIWQKMGWFKFLTFILLLYTMIITKIQNRKLWMWQCECDVDRHWTDTRHIHKIPI